MTVAAFPKSTRQHLEDQNLIAPTLQMILRRTQRGIYSNESYLTAQAHPTVFAKSNLQAERMVAMAGTLRPEDIPPMVRLKVEGESFARNAGLAQLSEKLFDTPSAVARIWRSEAYSQHMVISAVGTQSDDATPLSYHWAILRGDPDKIRILPQNDAHSIARIEVDWHDERPIAPRKKRLTSRIDIGLFVHNGRHYSTPGFVSVVFPTHQVRNYEPSDSSNALKLHSITYDAVAAGRPYDPMLYWSAPWTDTLAYDATGQIDKRYRVYHSNGEPPEPEARLVPATQSYQLKATKKGRILRQLPK